VNLKSPVYFASDLFKFVSVAEGAPAKLADGETYSVWIPIFREGKFKHPLYGDLNFDRKFLERIVENHKMKCLPYKVSFDVSHLPDNGAIGWIEDWENGLELRKVSYETSTGKKSKWFIFAKTELNPRGYSLVKNKEFRYFSSEIHPNYSTRELEDVRSYSGGSAEKMVEFGPVLQGGGLTNRPFIPHLGDIQFSEGMDASKLSEMKKKAEQLSHLVADDSDESGMWMFVDAREDVTASYKMSDSQSFKYDKINFVAPEAARTAAQQGLDYRKEFGRGGTPVGIARARDLANGKQLSPDTMKRMKAFFDRHQQNRNSEKRESDGGPTNGWIAWLLWGGDAGRTWAEKVVRQMEREDSMKTSTPDKGNLFDCGKEKYEWEDKGMLDEKGMGMLRAAVELLREIAQSDEKMSPELAGKINEAMKTVREVVAIAQYMPETSGIEEPSQAEVDEDYKNKPMMGLAQGNAERPHNFFHRDKQGEKIMKFSELLAGVAEFEQLRDQISYMEQNAAKFSESELELVMGLLDAKRQMFAIQQERDEAVQRKLMAEKKAEMFSTENAKLKTDLAEVKEGSWQNQVQVFCSNLRQDGHHESVVKTAESLLTNLKTESRDMKFSVVAEEESRELDLVAIFSELLAALPKSARMDFSEVTNANEAVEVVETEITPNPVAFSETTEQQVENSDSEEIPARIQKYSEVFGGIPARELWDAIDENGNFDMTKLG
jgi:hypothetical protein